MKFAMFQGPMSLDVNKHCKSFLRAIFAVQLTKEWRDMDASSAVWMISSATVVISVSVLPTNLRAWVKKSVTSVGYEL